MSLGAIGVRTPPPRRSRLARFALHLAVFAVLVCLYAIALIRAEALEPLPGLAAFGAGLALSGLAALLSLIAMAVVWRTGLRGGVRALFALVIAALTLAGPAYMLSRAGLTPSLDDVATDPSDPPTFAGAPSAPLDAARQRAAYPDLAPLRLSVPPEEAINLALGLMEQRGWRTIGPTAFPRGGPPRLRIEAVARSAVLGLPADVALRARPDGDGAVVDMRSASRLGGLDLGANAERVQAFLADLGAAAP
ncbi:hypothetical protein GCM10008171_34160 [Methylopila jiangsuensis]|uniref:DUF1499 domain-containing protein n=1 Tax=Methylopila jiangsuensis TaxID=586230 RepID=A0A9W6N5F4_9HYPH|nr:DUF1499 domain-containing protein [Methylopila jiangsuensis]MDR6284452.1 uncharacterized protein (DUF1499 family) [Methylopila jiangsuensis]GLK78162.1 hypothetical protein GCM10008171_34160 [Methylopila jiangsuensis]